MKHTVIITIGRNVGTAPMSMCDWQLFMGKVVEAIGEANGTVVQSAGGEYYQQGIWDGVYEDAAAFVAFVPVAHVPHLRGMLVSLKHRFNQEAIGFVVAKGTGHVI